MGFWRMEMKKKASRLIFQGWWVFSLVQREEEREEWSRENPREVWQCMGNLCMKNYEGRGHLCKKEGV